VARRHEAQVVTAAAPRSTTTPRPSSPVRPVPISRRFSHGYSTCCRLTPKLSCEGIHNNAAAQPLLP